MSRTFDIAYIVLLSLMLFMLTLSAYDGFEEVAWKHRCKDAGGFPAGHHVCVNPGAVIEVD